MRGRPAGSRGTGGIGGETYDLHLGADIISPTPMFSWQRRRHGLLHTRGVGFGVQHGVCASPMGGSMPGSLDLVSLEAYCCNALLQHEIDSLWVLWIAFCKTGIGLSRKRESDTYA